MSLKVNVDALKEKNILAGTWVNPLEWIGECKC